MDGVTKPIFRLIVHHISATCMGIFRSPFWHLKLIFYLIVWTLQEKRVYSGDPIATTSEVVAIGPPYKDDN